MDDKHFTTFERQIEILRSRGLIIGNEEAAYIALRRYGYYNIINGYKDPYVSIVDGKEVYKPGTTFEQVFSLYLFDRGIRNSVMESMQEIEDVLKAATAHTIAEAFTEKEELYLDWHNYRQGKKRGQEYQLTPILRKFNKLANDKKYSSHSPLQAGVWKCSTVGASKICKFWKHCKFHKASKARAETQNCCSRIRYPSSIHEHPRSGRCVYGLHICIS